MPLDIKKEFSEIQATYKELIAKRGFNLMVYSDKGGGKTTLITTGRKPIFIDSFDPGGTKSIKTEIDRGDVIADIRWECDSPDEPHVWIDWLAEMDRRRKEGFFECIGTYALDSLTTLQMASMAHVLRRKNRKDWIPKIEQRGGDNDYVLSQVPLQRAVEMILGFPCDCIFTAHPDLREDEGTKKQWIGPLLSGNLAVRLPLLFDEVYYAKAENTAKGRNYSLLTSPEGIFRASSRLGRRGLLETWEKPDLKYILKKVGYPYEDKMIP